MIFNLFINSLLKELPQLPHGAWIGDKHVISFAYADDITLLSGTVPGLQTLIDCCANYASRWRFRFGVNKTKCVIIGQSALPRKPTWFLNSVPIETNEKLDILGVTFQDSLHSSIHVEERITKCRRAFFGLREIGITNPTVQPDVKSHLWRTICSPTLTYGLECLKLSARDLHRLESLQGTLIKSSVDIGKRSHSTSLLDAMAVPRVKDILKQKTVSLFKDICRVEGPASDICLELLKLYVTSGQCIPGTIIHRIVEYGESPVHCLFKKMRVVPVYKEDGIVDTMKYILCHNNFIKPYSVEKDILRLLTRAF